MFKKLCILLSKNSLVDIKYGFNKYTRTYIIKRLKTHAFVFGHTLHVLESQKMQEYEVKKLVPKAE
jgi:hypothetical protein